MSQDIVKLGQDLMTMGQKILDSQGEKKKDEPKPEPREDDDTGGKVLDMPKKALIVASLKRKISE